MNTHVRLESRFASRQFVIAYDRFAIIAFAAASETADAASDRAGLFHCTPAAAVVTPAACRTRQETGDPLT